MLHILVYLLQLANHFIHPLYTCSVAVERAETPMLLANKDCSQSFLETQPEQQPPLKKRSSTIDDNDEMLITSIKNLRERQQDKQKGQLDEETHFGLQVAETLRRFNSKQRALAKLQIDQVLFNVEFPPKQPYYPPPTINNSMLLKADY